MNRHFVVTRAGIMSILIISVLFQSLTHADLTADYCSEIDIDGQLYEADCGQFFNITDESSPEGGATLDATIVWDMAFLYIRAQLGDSYVNAYVKSDDDTASLSDDCLQIFIDPDNSRDATMQESDRRFVLTVRDFLLDGSGWDNWDWDCSMIREIYHICTVNDNDDVDQGGSWIELGIPWQDLGVAPAGDMKMGILLGFTDRDTAGIPYPAYYNAIADPSRPDTWPVVVLEGNGTKAKRGMEQEHYSRKDCRNEIGMHGWTRKIVIDVPTLMFEMALLPGYYDIRGRKMTIGIPVMPRGIYSR